MQLFGRSVGDKRTTKGNKQKAREREKGSEIGKGKKEERGKRVRGGGEKRHEYDKKKVRVM